MTDPVRADTVAFFPSVNKNLASSVPGEILNFSQTSLWLLRCDFYIPSIYHLCMFEKAKQRPNRKGQPGAIFADPMIFFSLKAVDNIDTTGSVAEWVLLNSCKGLR